jgi:hypothetical protein
VSDGYRGVKNVVAVLVRDRAERRIDTHVSVAFTLQIADRLDGEVRNRFWFAVWRRIWRQLGDHVDE